MESVSRYLLTFLLNALWQIPVITLIALLGHRLMRNGPASHRHALFVVALIGSLLLPLASVRTSHRTATSSFDLAYVPSPAPAASSAPTPASASPASTPKSADRTVLLPGSFAGLILCLYAIWVIGRAALFARAAIGTVRLRQRSVPRPPSDPVARVWERCLRVLSIGRVELRASGGIRGPVTAGRIIILPDPLFNETSEDVLTTAVGHEMAHVARRDFPASLLYELLYLPISFHPAAWLIHREIERTREMACDELVASKLMDASVYARSIVGIAATMNGLRGPGYTLGVFDGNILEDRIRRLLERRAGNLRRARLVLAAGLGALVLCVAGISGLALPARAQGRAYNEMKIAESAYNSGDFATAAQHFEHAVQLEPSNPKPKLFLANTLLTQYFGTKRVPDSPLVAAARRQYLDVLSADPANRQALEGMVTIAMQTARPAESHDYALKLINVDPADKTAYYTVGVLDWATVYPELQRAKQAAGDRPEDYSISDPMARKSFRDRYEPLVQEGSGMLRKALRLDPGYDNAMAYLNLMYRLKAAMADTPSDAATLIAEADQWVGKALAAKKLRATSPPPPPPPLDVDAPPPGPAQARMAIAPPPPPPPPPPPAKGPTSEPASPAPPPGPRTAGMAGQYWQIVGSESGTPAIVLFRRVRHKGFPAVLAAPDDNLVRVLVGPYFSADAIEKARSQIEKAGYKPLRIW